MSGLICPSRSLPISAAMTSCGFFDSAVRFEQQAADLLAQRAHVPTLDAAHLGVEVAGQRVLERQQLDEVAPAQLCRQRRHNLLVRETLTELNGAVERAEAEGLPELDGQFA
jgi:hypothetical protein